MDQLRTTYLNDHLAASVAAVELARRSAQQNSGTALGDRLAELAEAIDQDRAALRSIMRQLGAGADPIKLSAGWMAEKLGRLKLNGRLFSYSPLSRLEEVELLLLGVEGKLLLWEALAEIPLARYPEPPLDHLTSRARSQRQVLRRLRLQAVRSAFPE